MSIREEIKSRPLPGRCAHRGGSKRRGSQTVTSSFPEKQTCLSTVYAAHVPLGFPSQRQEETSSNLFLVLGRKKQRHCRGAVGTSTRAVACASASQPQAVLCAHPPVLSHGHKNLLSAPESVGSALLALLLLPRRSSSSPAWEFSVSARSPFMLSTPVSMSPCRRSSRSSQSQWQSRSPSLGRVAHGRSCDPLRQLSGSRRDQRACRPSTSAEYQ